MSYILDIMNEARLSAHLQLKRAALEYVDQTGTLTDICTRCSHYRLTATERVFHFIIPVDPSDLLDLDVPFGNLVLNKPAGAVAIFKEVVFIAIEALELLPECHSPSQVVVHIRTTQLPSLPSYQITSCRDLSLHADKGRLLQLRGVVCGVSTIHKYTKSARFVCPESDCPGSEGNHFIRVHVTGAREDETIRNDFMCTFCSSVLDEDVSCRVLADKLVVEMVDEAAFEQRISGGCRHQAITAHIRDDLTREMEIGRTYTLIGVPVLDPVQQTVVLEVNNTIANARNELLNQNVSATENLPEMIQYIYNDRIKSPWSFTLSMAYSFASTVATAGSFLHLKLGLLLSLVGEEDCKIGRGLDVLAVGCDTCLLGRLLQYAGQFSRRLVVHGAACPLTAVPTKGRNQTVIDGGSLLLADRGVCLLPHLSSAKRAFKQTLQQVLETGQVYTEVPGRLAGDGRTHQVFLPVRCSVWAITDPLPSQPAKNDALSQAFVETVKISRQLADVFGMVYFADLVPDSYPEHMVVHQTLIRAMGLDPDPPITESQFKQLFRVARRVHAELSVEAEYLIRAYYVASRRVRSSNGSTLPQTAVSTITSLARSHAKLRLSEVVTEEDAVLAVLLYEESATYRYGQSPLGVKPLDHIQDNEIQNYIGPQRDAKLRMFQQQLRQFISVHAAEVELPDIEE